MICVTIACGSHSRMIQEHQKLADDGVKLVELRIDFLRREPELSLLIPKRPTHTIVTARRREDGGQWMDTEERRELLLRAAIAQGVEFVDLEEDAALKIPRFGKTQRIVSFHDMKSIPENLDELYDRLAKCDPDVIKIATMPKNIDDVVRMVEFVRRRNKTEHSAHTKDGRRVPLLGICMGEMGMCTRILGKKYGSPFTYTTFSETRVVAPGLIHYTKMRDMYRFDEVNANTKVFGVVGDPIAHSLSPLIHNASFADSGINAVYLPFRVTPEDIETFVARADEIGISGLSVTIPHKVTVMKKLTQFDPSVKDIGACNTIIVDNFARYGYNTDYVAAMLSIETAMGGRRTDGESPVKGNRALVLGAGGAGKAVAYGLQQRGAKVTVADIDTGRAEELASQLSCEFCEWEMRHGIRCGIVANCTPIGMHPNMNASPYERTALRQGMVVFDAVYNPENTLLIKDAKAKGCTTVSGVEMFVGQACLQFRLFTGKRASASLMRKTLKQAISAVKE